MRTIIIQQFGRLDSLVIENLPRPGPPIWKREGPTAMPKVSRVFAEYVGQHTKTREDLKSWFDALDLADYVSFGGKP
jgi:hypothetical protein